MRSRWHGWWLPTSLLKITHCRCLHHCVGDVIMPARSNTSSWHDLLAMYPGVRSVVWRSGAIPQVSLDENYRWNGRSGRNYTRIRPIVFCIVPDSSSAPTHLVEYLILILLWLNDKKRQRCHLRGTPSWVYHVAIIILTSVNYCLIGFGASKWQIIDG
jgi:hypothetical protein